MDAANSCGHITEFSTPAKFNGIARRVLPADATNPGFSLAINPNTRTQIYLKAADGVGVVRVNVTVNSSGFHFLGGSTRTTTDRTDFFTAHPDNSVRRRAPSE